jgi:hypothetical protein
MDDNQDEFGPGWADARLDDRGWKKRVGDDAEQAFREALRRAIAMRDGGNKNRVVVLVDVLNRLGELSGYDGFDLWDRD